MCSWSSKKITMINILLIFVYLSSSVKAQGNPFQCNPYGNYTRNSTYSANLNALLNSLSSNMTDNGYYTSSTGLSPNTVNGLALCRADRTLDECRACVDLATREVLSSCPNQRQAAIWYENCTLRYSNGPIHQEKTPKPSFYLYNVQNVTGGDQFQQELAMLLENLIARAANGNSRLKVGVGTRSYLFWAIYALLQCTPDFSSVECMSCLSEMTRGLENYISIGFRVLGPDYNIRYELTDFYNATRLIEIGVEPLVLSPRPPPSPSPSNLLLLNNSLFLLRFKSQLIKS